MKQQDISLLMKIASTSGNESAVTDTFPWGGRITLFEVGTFKYRLQRNTDDWVTS